MVDLAKYRDESYARWKGGAKLAAELRTFYTSKAAMQRIAAANPMAPTQAAGIGFRFRRAIMAGALGRRLGIRDGRRLNAAITRRLGHGIFDNGDNTGG